MLIICFLVLVDIIVFFIIKNIYKVISKFKINENFLLFVLPIAVIIEAAYIIHVESPGTTSEITADGMLGYVVGSLSFLSTLLLSILALWQTKQLNKENMKSQQLMNKMNERANEIAVQSNELNMITKIVDVQFERYQKIEHLLYQYCELMDSDSINSILTRVNKRLAKEQEEVNKTRRDNWSKLRIESQNIASNIKLLLSQDYREKSNEYNLIESMKKLDSKAFTKGMPSENDKQYLNSIEECRKEYLTNMIKHLSDYSSDLNYAMYNSLTLAEVRNLFNARNISKDQHSN